MIQRRIVEYAKSQLRLGVPREAIRSALEAAGWSDEDIDDSLRSAEANRVGVEYGAGLGAELKQEGKFYFDPAKEFSKNNFDWQLKKSEDRPVKSERPIVVSDLTAGLKFGAEEAAEKKEEIKAGQKVEQKKAEQKKEEAPKGEKPVQTGNLGAAPSRFTKSIVATIVLGILTLGFASTSAYLYLRNVSLAEELSMSENGSAELSAAITGLNARISELQDEIDEAWAEYDRVELELSFFAIRPGLSAETEANFSGLLGRLRGGDGDSYVLITSRGSELEVLNSGADEAFAPFLNGEEASFSGTYFLGSGAVTITAINDIQI